ncbi:MFS transporter [Candidatus Falkowbacteria bacterium]|nr:MFS transporter [Candidatus Falkowbacteria bacterium]
MKINTFYKILISSYGFSLFSESILVPIYAIFVQKIGGDILAASGAMATFLLTQGIFTLIIHRVQWKNKIALLCGGWIIWVIGIASYLFISNIFMLFVTQILTAMGNAIADPLLFEELAEHTDRRAKEFEWRFFSGLEALVGGVAAIIGGLVATFYGFTILIYMMIASATISLLFILYYIKQQRHQGILHRF